MGVTIVVGGQFGGEGKGKVVYELGRSMDVDIGVKVGGTNCGHTIMIDHKLVILRQLPTTALLNDSISIIAAGSYIDLDLLFDEMKICGIGRDQVFIDPNAVIISKEHKIAEQKAVSPKE
jgi:adenylosuccinate synthase